MRQAPAPRGYREAVARWHEAPKDAKPALDATGRPMLTLVSLNTADHASIAAASDDGGFDAEALETAARVLRDPRTGLAHPVDPRLLDVVYRAQRAFGAHEIRVISGYRAPSGKGTSNHGRGRAMDIVVPGARDDKLAAWARGLGFTGVGLYPQSGFCHVDVRPQSHFWVDGSGPRQRSREVPVKGGLAARADADARARAARAVPPFVLPTSDVASALKTGSAPAAGAEGAHDDDDDARDGD